MNKGKPDTLTDPRATVWPPAPTVPVTWIDPDAELDKAIEHAFKWSLWFSVIGVASASPLTSIASGILFDLSDIAARILHNCLWPLPFLVAAYQDRRVYLLTRRANTPRLVVQDNSTFIFSLFIISVWLCVAIFG